MSDSVHHTVFSKGLSAEGGRLVTDVVTESAKAEID